MNCKQDVHKEQGKEGSDKWLQEEMERYKEKVEE